MLLYLSCGSSDSQERYNLALASYKGYDSVTSFLSILLQIIVLLEYYHMRPHYAAACAGSYIPTLRGSSALLLSLPTVGYVTVPTFHSMGLPVNSKVNVDTSIERTTSARDR